MKTIQSLGLNTDIMFYKHSAIVEQKKDYSVVRSLQNPGYFWGNLLIYPCGATQHDFDVWIKDFHTEFGANPKIEHKTFAWDLSEEVFIDRFCEAGFDYDESLVLAASESLNVQYFNERHFRPFIIKQFANYKNLTETGFGHWYGAYIHKKLLSDLGLYWENNKEAYVKP